MGNEIIDFVAKFFKSLGANVMLQGNYIIIQKVPNHFQKFYGKNEPYKFTLKKELESSDIEFLEKGSYTMKTISSYLENSGETTLLKIDFEVDPEKEIKKRLKLKNCRLIKLTPRKKYDLFFRFTFHSSFQYLNERDKVINEIYIHNNKVVKGDLKDYPVIEGKRSEIRIPDMKEPYFVAKDKLKELLKNKTEDIAKELGSELEKAIMRIESHFKREGEELYGNLQKTVEKFNEAVNENDEVKIQRQKKMLHNLKEKLNPEERKKDMDRSILIEKGRHSLNVNNKLFNTTLIYHPIFSYVASLKNSDISVNLQISFNPLLEKLEPIICENCGDETLELNLCKNGHIVCGKCLTHCESCGKEFCKKCIKTRCQLCNSYICDDCKTTCFGCGKVMCKTHTQIDKFSGKTYCNKCLTHCERCGSLKVGSYFKISPKTGVKICEECYRKEMQNKVLDSVFD